MNWSACNDSLARRGEILLDLSILLEWDGDVRHMNDSRRVGDLVKEITMKASLCNLSIRMTKTAYEKARSKHRTDIKRH